MTVAADALMQAEAGRLGEQISFELPNMTSRIVTLTASAEGEGVSTLTLALALNLSSNPSSRVLFIDGNIRNPADLDLEEGSAGAGFVEFLLEGLPAEKAVAKMRGTSIDVLALGRQNAATLSQIGEAQLRGAFDSLRERYDHILIDTAPPRRTPFSLTLAKLSDAVIVVAQADKTSRYAVGDSINRIADAPLIGVALTRTTEPWPVRL